jgi:predicted anti-sigma-YlaC factor YlaD
MRCESVRERLPGYLDGDLRPVGALDQHLAACTGCREELESYRELRSRLVDLGERPEPSPELLPLLLQLISHPARGKPGVAVHDARLRYAIASLGGAAVGATALALVWWRRTRRDSSHDLEGEPQTRVAG